jgi:hypothetical protein
MKLLSEKGTSLFKIVLIKFKEGSPELKYN